MKKTDNQELIIVGGGGGVGWGGVWFGGVFGWCGVVVLWFGGVGFGGKFKRWSFKGGVDGSLEKNSGTATHRTKFS